MKRFCFNCARQFYSGIECPFCGEVHEDLASHLQSCEFAPDDASIEDILPSKPKRKKRKAPSSKPKSGTGSAKEKCPYCGKEFTRLGRHISSCPQRPKDEDEDSEE